MKGSLRDQVLLVTGSSGIAAETIRLAVSEFAKVYFCSWDESSCHALKSEIGNDERAGYCVGDLTKEETIKKVVSNCIQKFGKIDALFNVAGISGRRFGDGPAHQCTDEAWIRTMESNSTTQFRMCREVISHMLNASPDAYGTRGVILNMTSILGIDPEPHHFSTVAYACSKGALVSLTRSIASTYCSQGIRANAIAPGLTDTPMSSRSIQKAEIQDFILQKQPLSQGVIHSLDIARVALFLLSNQSRVITGQTIIADGGWTVS